MERMAEPTRSELHFLACLFRLVNYFRKNVKSINGFTSSNCVRENEKIKINFFFLSSFRKEIYFILKIYFTNPSWDKKYFTELINFHSSLLYKHDVYINL